MLNTVIGLPMFYTLTFGKLILPKQLFSVSSNILMHSNTGDCYVLLMMDMTSDTSDTVDHHIKAEKAAGCTGVCFRVTLYVCLNYAFLWLLQVGFHFFCLGCATGFYLKALIVCYICCFFSTL